MKGQFVIIDLRTMDFMKNEGKIIYYDTFDEACSVCSMCEFENAWVMQLMYNHIEKQILQQRNKFIFSTEQAKNNVEK